jgi:hypothetical protein
MLGQIDDDNRRNKMKRGNGGNRAIYSTKQWRMTEVGLNCSFSDSLQGSVRVTVLTLLSP